MWVKTQDGNLVNLDAVAAIEFVHESEESYSRIVAHKDIAVHDRMYDEKITLAFFPTERKARNVMNAIARSIIEDSKFFYMPQWETAKHDDD